MKTLLASDEPPRPQPVPLITVSTGTSTNTVWLAGPIITTNVAVPITAGEAVVPRPPREPYRTTAYVGRPVPQLPAAGEEPWTS